MGSAGYTFCMKKMILYTDGGARGNPGPAGAGAYITDGEGNWIGSVSKFLGVRTNNWAEYEALILGLEAIKRKVPEKERKGVSIEVRLDSELITRQLNNIYQVKEESLFPQFIKVHNMRVKDFPLMTFTHIPREKNEEADRLANEAMDRGE